ncbi:MAG: hydroxymethylpyrimidine/phosphomethylpyrimidine kinase [Betaproteobacteria bacterium]|nr:hydroxymethylpyrimidine/phosphomethylpyrimidine kinase [Betaproteobacteria bacterium]
MTTTRHAGPPLVLVFAGSDPTGGAGLQADLLTVCGMGCHGLTVVTAITVQDTVGVTDVVPISTDLVSAQAKALLNDVSIVAIKVGVVGSYTNALAISAVAREYPNIPLILDPVLASGRNDPLGPEDVMAGLLEHLVPIATLVTPNSVEARRLAGDPTGGELSLDDCARSLTDRGARHVLITGTHEPTELVVNLLYDQSGRIREDHWKRLAGEYHGSGCTLASAVAAAIANGFALEEAVRAAQDYTWHALKSGFQPGKGQSIPDRFFWARAADSQPATQTTVAPG